MANVPRSGSRRLRDSWPDSRRTFNTSNVWPRRRWNGWVTVAEPKERLASSAVRWVCANLRGQSGATRRDDDAGGGLRTGLLTLLVWLPPGPLGSPGAPHVAEHTLGQATLLGDRHRHTQVFRFDSALSPPNVPRPTSHGRRHPTDDRQMAEGRGRRRRSPAPHDRGFPARGRDLALPLERLSALCAGRMVRDRGEAAPQRGKHPCPVRRRCDHGVRQYRRRQTRAGGPGEASCAIWAHAPSRQDTPRRFPPTNDRGRTPSGDGWDQLRLPRPDPCLGTVAERQEHGQAGHGQKPFCPCSGRGERLVSETPALVHPRPASPSVINDAGPLRLLRRWRQHSTIAMVRPSSGADMAEVAVSARSPKRRPLGAPQRTPETPSTASSPDCPRIHRRERISLVKNRMRQFRKSGSVRDEGGNVLIYSAMTPCGREHAAFVRGLFRRYLEIGSVVRMKDVLDDENCQMPVGEPAATAAMPSTIA